MATPIRDIPRDVLSIRVSNVTILEGAEVRIGFYGRGGGSSEGTLPRVPKALRGGPEVDPDP